MCTYVKSNLKTKIELSGLYFFEFDPGGEKTGALN